jgi:ribosome biogenesis GTPase
VTLAVLGWGPALAEAFQPHADAGLRPGRVAIQHRGAYVLLADEGEVWADLPGRLVHAGDMPAVGDWVAYDRPPGSERATVAALLPRRSAFTRKQAGLAAVEQVIAAYVDVLLLVSSLIGDINARRIERYLTLAWESGADPVVVLTKADVCEDVDSVLREVEPVVAGVPVLVTSVVSGVGIDALRGRVGPGVTAAAVGSSGVGKSTLVNHLCTEARLATAELRADGRGRHTTTHRELIVLPGGGCIIDTPGMRELALWEAGDGLERAFEDVELLAAGCRFTDCRHDGEPGCEVRAAIAAGTLDVERLESYRHLERELHHLEIRTDARARSEERRRWRAINRANRLRSRP